MLKFALQLYLLLLNSFILLANIFGIEQHVFIIELEYLERQVLSRAPYS